MKKFGFMVLLVAVLSAPVFADTLTTTVIRAVVGADLNITSDMSAVEEVNPALTSATLGNVTISSNMTGNWRIVVTSANDGAMVRVGGTDRYPYLLNFGTTVGHNLATDLSITNTGVQSSLTVPVSLTYQTAASLALPAGTYEDTLTISLLAP